MARADLLISLVRAARSNDDVAIRRVVEALASDERAKHHHILADRLMDQLKSEKSVTIRASTIGQSDKPTVWYEVAPRRRINDLILDPEVLRSVNELIEEHHRSDLLRSFNVEPRHSVLLAGPPGNGKTTLAEAIAEALMVPMYVARYESIIGSFLGETAANLARLFEFVRSRECVLFLDEFDVIGKERGDAHETGEIKRVVSSLLMQIDSLPSYCVVVTATNHPELLDRAAWRRFQLRLEMEPPSPKLMLQWIEMFEKRMEIPFGVSRRSLANRLAGLSYSELEDFGMDVLRRYILSQPDSSMTQIVEQRLYRQNRMLHAGPTNGESDLG